MTQDVQPLTWQKRTNLEEHQQFFSKINEIIDNLAPTVDEAEAAIAQATAAIASANDAIATANAASAAASAAASQAQTAANTVAGYDTRLTAAEGDIDSLQAADQTITGNVAALGTRMTAAESKNSQQDTDIAALQTADAQNVKISRINEYAVGLTGNQPVLGVKSWLQRIDGILNQHEFGTTARDRSGYWFKVGIISAAIASVFCGRFLIHTNNSQYCEFVATNAGIFGYSRANAEAYKIKPIVVAKSDGSREIWAQVTRAYGYLYCIVLGLSRYGSSQGMDSYTHSFDIYQQNKPEVGGDITAVYDMVEI